MKQLGRLDYLCGILRVSHAPLSAEVESGMDSVRFRSLVLLRGTVVGSWSRGTGGRRRRTFLPPTPSRPSRESDVAVSDRSCAQRVNKEKELRY